MRKALFAAATIATMTSTVSALEIGLDANISFSSEKNTTIPVEGDETITKQGINTFYLQPRVSIELSDNFNLVPYVGFGTFTSRYVEKSVDTEYKEEKYKETQLILGAGVGAEFNLIDQDWFQLSTGPRFNWGILSSPKGDDAPEYDKYLEMLIGIDAPLNLDFNVSDIFGIRLATELADFTLNTSSTKGKDEGAAEYKYSNPSFTLLGMDGLPLSAGVFFNF